MTTHPLYIDCKSIHEKEVSIRDYKAKNITRLFGSFSTFLHPFQKQVKKGIFKKDPIKTMRLVLDVVYEIVEISTTQDYSNEMMEDMKHVFITLLHPANWSEYRYYGIKLLCSLVHILGSRASFFIDGFLNYVIDFTPFADQCAPESNLNIQANPDLRIQINDSQPPDKKNTIAQIQYIISSMIKSNDDEFIIWWKILLKSLLLPSFRQVAINCKVIGSEFGIIGPCPELIINEIRTLMFFLVERPPILIHILQVQYTAEIIFEFFTQLLNYYPNPIENSEITLRFITILTQENSELLENLLPKYHDLAVQSLDYILKIFKLSSQAGPEFINNITEVFKTLIISFFKKFTKDDQLQLIKKVMTFESTISISSHMFCVLITTMYNLSILDQDIWQEVKNNMKSDLHVYTFGIFMSYLAVFNTNILLKFNYSDLNITSKLSAQYTSWERYHATWIDKFSNINEKNLTEFFKSSTSVLLYPEILDHWNQASLNLQEVNTAKTAEQITEILHLIRDIFQFKPLIYISYINSIVKLSNAMPLMLEYNKTFIFSEFLNFLRPILIHPDVKCKVRSITIMGDILSLPIANNLLSDPTLAEIYDALIKNVQSKDEELRFASYSSMMKILTSGLRYSNICTQPILHADIPKKIYDATRLVSSFTASARTLLQNSKVMTEIDQKTESAIVLLTESLSSPSKIQVLLSILIEEAIHGRKQTMMSVTTQMMNTIAYRNVPDIIAFSQIVLIIPYLIKTFPQIIETIVNSFITILEQKSRDNPQFIVILLRLLIDILLISGQYMSVQNYITKLHSVIEMLIREDKNLTPDKIEQINDQMLLLEMLLGRIPLQSYEKPAGIGENYMSFFKDNEVLNISDSNLLSTTAVGQFNWKYSSIGHKNVINPVYKIPEAPAPVPVTDQKEFRNSITKEISGMFDFDLANLGITTKLYTPENIGLTQSDFNETLTNQNTDVSAHRTERDYEVAHIPSQFMTSLGYYKIGNNESIIPSKNDNKFIDTINYVKSTTVSLISFGQFPQFEELTASLGLLNSDKSIVYADHRRKIVFMRGAEAKIRPVIVVWREGATDSKIASTCTPEVGVRLLISPMENGLCKLEVSMNKNIDIKKVLLSSLIVTKQALPLHIISQIVVLSELLEDANTKIIDPPAHARETIKKAMSEEQTAYPEPLVATKVLLKSCK